MKATLSLAVFALLNNVEAVNIKSLTEPGQLESEVAAKFWKSIPEAAGQATVNPKPVKTMHGDPRNGDKMYHAFNNDQIDNLGYYAQLDQPTYQKHPKYDVMIQMKDHENDTDDVVPVEEYTQSKADDHENDTEDIVHEFDDSLHSQIFEQAENAQQQKQRERGSAARKLKEVKAQEEYNQLSQQNMLVPPLDIDYALLNEHQNDSDDTPSDQEPLQFQLAHRKNRGDPYQTTQELAQENHQKYLSAQAEEIREIQKEQQAEDNADAEYKQQKDQAIAQQNAQRDANEHKYDENLVQIDGMAHHRSRHYIHMPHSMDTDDVDTDDMKSLGYNPRHSKQWNDEVNNKAVELDNEIKIQENEAVLQKKQAAEAKVRAQQERIRLAEEMRQQAENSQRSDMLNSRYNKQTIDLSELYTPVIANDKLVNSLNVQLKDEDDEYRHHSSFMQQELAQQERQYDIDEMRNQKLMELDEQMDRIREEALNVQDQSPENMNRIYDDIELQTSDDGSLAQRHSEYWEKQVDKQEQKLEREMQAAEQLEQKQAMEADAANSEAHGHYHKKTIDHEQLYDGLAVQTSQHHTDAFAARVAAAEQALPQEEGSSSAETTEGQRSRIESNGMTAAQRSTEVQGGLAEAALVQFDHENDNDDLVPELTESVAVATTKAPEQKPGKVDFAGAKYEETYDD